MDNIMLLFVLQIFIQISGGKTILVELVSMKANKPFRVDLCVRFNV